MSDDVWDGSSRRSMSVTVKYGKGFEAPWAVFHGSPDEVREDICKFFDLDADGLTGHALLTNAVSLAQGSLTVVKGIGATYRKTADKTNVVEADATDDPWAEAETAEGGDKPDPLAEHYTAVASIDNVDSLKRYWAEHQEEFKNAELLAAWKSRGKELAAAAA